MRRTGEHLPHRAAVHTVRLVAQEADSLGGRRTFDIQVDINNVFNNINFNPVFNPDGGATAFQTNSHYMDISQSYDPGGRLGQIIVRVNW